MTTLSRRAMLAATAGLAVTACSTSERDRPTENTGADGGYPLPRHPFDHTKLHRWTLRIDADDYDEMLGTYLETEEKEWIDTSATIDRRSFHHAALRLKGNSSLTGVDEGSDPTGLPWLLALDHTKEQQHLQGRSELVIRSNTTHTALNEAVALDLLALTGLASQAAIHTRLTVNDSDPRLRLVIEHPEERWEQTHFRGRGGLFKAESGGDYTYRGADHDAYAEVFDQETGEAHTAGLTPLVEFLKFINHATDRRFAAELHQHLDVPAFARYLAYQNLIRNGDAISGLGNNSYLRYTVPTRQFTVVAWDHNLAFFGNELDLPKAGTSTTTRPEPDSGVAEETITEQPNVLERRFANVPALRRLYRRQRRQLLDQLFAGPQAERLLQRRADVLRAQASDLVSPDQVDAEAASIHTVLADLRNRR